MLQPPALPQLDARPFRDSEAFRFVPRKMLEQWRSMDSGSIFGPDDLAAQVRAYDVFLRLVGRLHRAGVPILAGTDATLMAETRWLVPGFSVHDERFLLVEAGLSPVEAIASATSVPADLFGRSDGGSIEVGKRADLVLLAADPSIDIRNMRRIEAVVSAGQMLDRAALDALLEGAWEMAVKAPRR